MYFEAELSTVIILLLSIGLSIIISMNLFRKRATSLLYWSSGLWVFSISVAIEVVFAFGIFSGILIRSYLFLVAILVEFLALGSVSLLNKKTIAESYLIFNIGADIFLLFSLATTSVGDIITHGVVFGPLPLLVTIASSIVTFPAAVLLVLISAISYRKTRNNKLLSIIVGVIVVSIAGTLYIAAFPSFLYYAELAGIALLWLGFVDFKSLSKSTAAKHGEPS
ncbi:MAG: hypothetical protein M1327_03005 [Candidatus Thermoplasmatota archaeon]|nr:hypothetical protein [Candidatus Thermoplasmatota archaeon]